MLDSRRLLTFGEVARRRSFSRAAEALALTQPAVSQQVAALERQLGVRLLDRGPGGPTVTEAGALLLAHADAVADRLAQADTPGRRARRRGPRDAADRRLPERAGLDRATARSSGCTTSGPSWCSTSSRARRTSRAPPSPPATSTSPSASRTRARRRTGPRGPSGTCSARSRCSPASRSTIRWRRRDSIRLAELADATWTAPSREHLIHRTCVAAGFEPHIAYVTRDPLAIAGLIGAGLAVLARPAAAGGPAARRRARRGLRPRAAAHALRAHPRLRHPAGGARLHRRAQRYAGWPVSAWPSTSVWMSAVPS